LELTQTVKKLQEERKKLSDEYQNERILTKEKLSNLKQTNFELTQKVQKLLNEKELLVNQNQNEIRQAAIEQNELKKQKEEIKQDLIRKTDEQLKEKDDLIVEHRNKLALINQHMQVLLDSKKALSEKVQTLSCDLETTRLEMAEVNNANGDLKQQSERLVEENKKLVCLNEELLKRAKLDAGALVTKTKLLESANFKLSELELKVEKLSKFIKKQMATLNSIIEEHAHVSDGQSFDADKVLNTVSNLENVIPMSENVCFN
jgi:chromosome segregation ATPase